MKEFSFNILIDESGDSTNLKDNPSNRAIGALIFFREYDALERNFLSFVKKNFQLKRFLDNKPHDLKYETLKKQPNAEELLGSILTFLIHQKCKFYWHPIKEQSKKHSPKIDGIRVTKLIESCNLDILPNLILRLKADGKKIGKVTLYCDGGTYNPSDKSKALCFWIGQNSFSFSESLDEKYKVELIFVKSKKLHYCVDIIAGIARENFNKWPPYNRFYQLLMENKFMDIVENEFT